jgi:hypothetical protein
MGAWKYTRFISRVEHDISLVRCAHSWDIMFNTRNKSGIPAHPCIILYLFNGSNVNNVVYLTVQTSITQSILREPLSILIKYKTIDTPKIESILKNILKKCFQNAFNFRSIYCFAVNIACKFKYYISKSKLVLSDCSLLAAWNLEGETF